MLRLSLQTDSIGLEPFFKDVITESILRLVLFDLELVYLLLQLAFHLLLAAVGILTLQTQPPFVVLFLIRVNLGELVPKVFVFEQFFPRLLDDIVLQNVVDLRPVLWLLLEQE